MPHRAPFRFSVLLAALTFPLFGCTDTTRVVGIEEAEPPTVVDVDWPADGRFEGTTPVAVAVRDRISPALLVEVTVGDTVLARRRLENDGGSQQARLLIPSHEVRGETIATVQVTDQAENQSRVERTLRPRNRTVTALHETQLPGCYRDVRDIAQGPEGRTWFATESGIAAARDTTVELYASAEPLGTCYGRGFSGLATEADGTLWALAAIPYEGLALFRRQGDTFERVGPFDTGRAVIIVDFGVRHGALWLVTAREVYRARPGAQPRAVYTVDDALANEIRDADLAPDGSLWLAKAQETGRLRPDGTFEPVAVETDAVGWASPTITAVSDSEAWLGRGRSLVHVTPEGAEALDLPRRITPETCSDPGALQEIALAPDGNPSWLAAGAAGGVRLGGDRYYLYQGEWLADQACAPATRVHLPGDGGAYLTGDDRTVFYLGP